MAFLISANASAQNTGKIHFMMVTIHAGDAATHPRLIVTREDGTQEVRAAAKGSWMDKATTFDRNDEKFAADEDSLFQTLKPFFDAGWQLAGSTMTTNNGLEDYMARYYFTRKD
jgi:hypothetical protein